METIRKIRLAARDLRLSRNTVRKVLRSGETRFEYHRETVHRPQLAAYVERLEGLLEGEESLPVKQRRTMLSLYEALQIEGYRGGYDTVRRYVKGWREAHSALGESSASRAIAATSRLATGAIGPAIADGASDFAHRARLNRGGKKWGSPGTDRATSRWLLASSEWFRLAPAGCYASSCGARAGRICGRVDGRPEGSDRRPLPYHGPDS